MGWYMYVKYLQKFMYVSIIYKTSKFYNYVIAVLINWT